MTKRDFRIGSKRLHPDLDVEILSGLPPEETMPSLFNISRGGMFLEGPAQLPQGANLQLALKFGEHDRIVANTDVRWVRPSPNGPFQPQGLGVQFTQLDPKDRALLENYLDEGAVHLTVADIMAVGDFSIQPDMRVRDLAAIRSQRYFPAAVVREKSGTARGLVPAEWLFSLSLTSRIGDWPVSEVMVPTAFISPEIGGNELVRGLFAASDMNYIVGSPDGDLYGLLTQDMIENLWPVLLRSFIRESNQPLEQSMYRLVHDIRTPLTAIQATHGLLTEGTIDLPTYLHSGFATAVEANCRRLMDLTEDILRLASGQPTNQPVSHQEINIAELVSETCERLSPLAQRRSLSIIRRIPQSLTWPTAPRILTRLIENLLGNSLRNAASGSEIVIVSDCDSRWLGLTVSDQGSGLSDETLNSIKMTLEGAGHGFPTPQINAGQQTTSEYQSPHGFGLAIVRQLLGILNGEASVTPNAKGGITVQLKLPRPSVIIGSP